MCNDFSMSTWSFVSDDAFLKVLSVGRKDCKWTFHNIHLDFLHNSNKNSRGLYKIDTNSVLPVYIVSPEIKLQEFTCLLIARVLPSIFMLRILFRSFFFLITFSPLMALGITNSICIWSHNLFLFLRKLQPPFHTRNAFAKKTDKIRQCLCPYWFFFFLNTWIPIQIILEWMCSVHL